jgi:hypothetical protein
MTCYVAKDALIYQVDGSGYIGFMSQRHIVNGDGLVNTHDYAKKLLSGKFKSTLTKTRFS